MATITVDKLVPATAGTVAAAAPKSGWTSFFTRMYKAMAEAQELRAQTYVRGYLAHLTDGELAELGMTRDQMIRQTRNLMTSF